MTIQKIPLRDRLRRFSNCCPAHPEYIPALLRDFAALPITEYLADLPEDLTRLACLLQYPGSYMQELTYSDVAARVLEMHRYGRDGEALEILVKPFTMIYQKYQERKGLNE